jgi:hypothetical protein
LWINSFAHGRTVYDLRFDLAAILDAIEQAANNDVMFVLDEVFAHAELNEDELDTLQDAIAERTDNGKRVIAKRLKRLQEEQKKEQARQDRLRRAAQRTDRRPFISVPDDDAEWLPTMKVLNEVLGRSTAAIPPARNLDGFVTVPRKLIVPGTHALGDHPDQEGRYRLPVPEQWLLHPLGAIELSELIERHIEFHFMGTSVHLPMAFVHHYVRRIDDHALPKLKALVTTPLVRPDGTVISPGDSLDRVSGTVYKIPKELLAILPRIEDCTEDTIKAAIDFLFDDWLVDVKTDDTGKSIIVASALTLMERVLLEDRPTFNITAGKRGGGKTTVVKMLVEAIFGVRAAASAWSTSAEERRKTLLAMLMTGVGYCAWDNIEAGTQFSCPYIEMSCTSAEYSDRILGKSENRVAPAYMIHFFTGNNIAACGDSASRNLKVELIVDRVDPENREFKHPDVLEWTRAHRAKILHALYVILIGNPKLQLALDAQMKTRFKTWYRLCGSAIEHAMTLRDYALDFRTVFTKQEEDSDTNTISLADFLLTMSEEWPKGFTAGELAEEINKDSIEAGFAWYGIVEFLFPENKAKAKGAFVTPSAVSKRLARHLNCPTTVAVGNTLKTLQLIESKDTHTKLRTFNVVEAKAKA